MSDWMEKPNKKNIEDIFALTPIQEGMLFHYLKDGGSSQYFEQLCLDISGDIDIKLFEQAWNVVIDTNEMLRTAFRWKKVRKPVQVVFNMYTVKLKYYDFSNRDNSERKKFSDEIITKDRWEKFDLSRVPFRVTLCKIDQFKYRMIISNHHILYDGWSNGIILQEFFAIYTNLANKKKPEKTDKSKFKEFVQWLNKQDKKEQKKFWKEYLRDFTEPTILLAKGKAGKEINTPGNFHITLKQDIRERLEKFIHLYKVTLAALLYSVWGILLQKYNNIDDVVFGTTISGRPAKIKGIEKIVGLFINTLPLRMRHYPGERTIDLLHRVQEDLETRRPYESTSLVKIKEYSQLGYNDVLFDSIVVIENYPLDIQLQEARAGQLSVDSYSTFETTNYDLILGITLSKDTAVNFVYNIQLYEPETIERLAHHFTVLLEEIIQNPREKRTELDILSTGEKRQLLLDFNGVRADFPKNKTLVQLFEEQVERTPDNISAAGEMQSVERKAQSIERNKERHAPCAMSCALTYKELNEKSAGLAFLLKERGVFPYTIAAIMAYRSVETIIGILGILKAGGAYLPIDPDYPQDRIKYMLADSGTKILLSEDRHSVFPASQLYSFPASLPSSLAYVIYTSGSTGRPKGVLVEHHSVVNLALSQKNYFNINENDRILQFSSLCFDASVEQIFIALFSGAVLVLVDRNTLLDSSKFEEFISSRSITHLHAVPLFLSNVKMRDTFKLKRVISGGDVCPVALAKKWSKYCDFYNEYGPTETTVTSIEMKVGSEEVNESLSRLPVGRPIGNTTIYLIDKWMKLVPPEVVGELHIGGEGVARGYLNRPELTAEKFDHDLWDYQDYHDKTGKKNYTHMSHVYKTGDLARWLPEGNIEFMGRIDRQVKIRGFRIELEEIESQILTYSGIKDAVVLARGDESGDKYLCAYIVLDYSEPGQAFDSQELKEYLFKFLPDYMVPAYFIRIDELPFTPTGKTDRRALPAPGIGRGDKYIAPRNEVERRLADIWGEVLLLSVPISIDDNFFQLGGHSLKAVLLLAKIHKAFNVDLPLAEMFKSPTIRRLSQYIRDAIEEQYLSIEAAEKKEYYTLSSAQKRLYFLQQIDESGTAYNMTSVWVLKGSPDKNRLGNTFRALVQRHESLRTSFKMIENEPVQRVHDKTVIGHWSLVIAEAARKEIVNTIKSFVKPFDLSQAPLLRVGLIKLLHTPTAPRGHPSQEGTSKRSCILMVDMHHIISDGISSGVLVQDFAALYLGDGLPGMRVQYKDYAWWQNCEKESIRVQEQALYWQKEFKAEIPVLDLPTDYVRPTIQRFEGSSLSFEIGRETTEPLKVLALGGGATLYMVLLTIYTIFLSKISNQEDIVIGAPVAGRRHADLGKIVGMFVNTLALRNYPAGEKTFTRFLAEIKEKTLQAFENQEYQYEDLVEQVVVNRDVSRNPLFDVSFLFQNMEVSELAIPGLKFTPYEYETFTSKFDLTLESMETEDALLFRFEYNTKLFKPETIERFVNYFKNLVSGIHEDKKRKLSKLEIISEEEKHQVLYDFNDTKADYPKDKTLHELFAEQVEWTPDNIALVGVHETHEKHKKNYNMPHLSHMSYKELNEKSGQLARYLRSKGVRPDTIVGIMVERSIEMIIGIFGILKAGGAYLPIDPEYPEERINYILADSAAKILLTSDAINRIPTPSHLHLSPAPVTSLAYIIYTSGSVGRPKGVLVQHGSVVNILMALFKKYPFSKRDIYLLKTSYMFDVSVSELFGWFLGGGRLAILKPGGEKDPGKILDCIERISISHINFVPSMFGVFLEVLDARKIRQLSGLKYIFLAGEALSPYLVNKFKGLNPRIVLENIYGPTESTIYASQYPLSEWKGTGNISIGKPLQNIRLYILGKYDQLQPIGVSGELCISGIGLARGYLNRPELTTERFCLRQPGGALFVKTAPPGPPRKNFLLRIPGSGSRLHMSYMSHMSYIYHTGDLARWLPDGNIEFLGRIDHQVKIRGFRIELEEIESQLLTYKGIKDAVVLARGDESGDKYLCAYIVRDGSVPGQAFNSQEIQEYLFKFLPDYMVPFYFIRIDELPLTTTGKTDRRTLPAPEICPGDKYTPPRDEVERRLADIWEEVLLLPVPISIDANFFQLGGHSLRAVILRAKIHKAFNVNLPLAEIFKSPSIRRLSQYIRDAVEEKYLSIEAAEKKEYYALSSAQKRLYFLQQMDEEGIGYNIPSVWNMEGNVDTVKFEEVFPGLIQRHESLRTSFHMKDDQPVQRIHDQVEFVIEYYDLKEVKVEVEVKHLEGTRGLAPLSIPAARSSQPAAALISSFIRPFNLSQAPLMRVGLIKLPHTPTAIRGHPSQEGKEYKYLLMVDMHHIISDGLSIAQLIREFMAGCEGKQLQDLKLQYKDYSKWQNSDKERASYLEQGKYWQKNFPGDLPVLHLPLDYPRPAVQSFEGAALDFEISREQTEALKSCALKEGATLFMMLLTITTIFVSKITNQEDIIIGTPTAGRQHPDLEPIIGMFVNTLPLRNYPTGEKTLKNFLKEVKQTTLDGFENQSYQYEELVEQLGGKREPGRNPLFDVMLVLQNMESTQIEIPGLKLRPYLYETGTSKFDLMVIGNEIKEGLSFTVEYCTRLSKPETILRYIGNFKKIVSEIPTAAGKKLYEIEMISEEEKHRILEGFNNTATRYPGESTIHQLFQKQVEKTPDHTALLWAHETHEKHEKNYNMSYLSHMSYKKLNEKSNQLASVLREKGVTPDALVALIIERSIEMMIGILAVLKAGGAYLPVDPDYPDERVTYILEDSQTGVLLTHSALMKKNRFQFKGQCIPLDDDSITPAAAAAGKGIKNTNHPDDLAYVMYTSGSTARPKGVLVKHRNVTRLVIHTNYAALTKETRILQTGAPVFDATTFEIWGALLNGGQLYLVDNQVILDVFQLGQMIETNRINTLWLTSALFNQLAWKNCNIFSNLDYLLVGGDILNPQTINLVRSKSKTLKVINGYGPTENTTFSTTYLIEKDFDSSIPIGRPIANSTAFILNQYGTPQPIGIFGELWVGGHGVSRGYLNSPELTGEKFVKDTLLKGKHLYRTGDITRWMPDGNIEFSGRVDHQVKIRGFRIEPGEIEYSLLRHAAISEAVVIVDSDKNENKFLCAYIVSDAELSISQLRHYLSGELPAYMIPSFFVLLDKIPLTPNGKVDRRALPPPAVKGGKDYTPPRDKIEESLVEIWTQLLDINQGAVGIDDDFFELGGHSLKATALVSKIQEKLKVSISLAEVFTTPTIRELSRYIKNKQEEVYASIEPAEKKGYYVLSSTQKRMYILQQLELASTSYNTPLVLPLREDIKREKVEQAFKKLIARHESLRTSFEMVNEEPRQHIHDEVEFEIEYYDLKEVKVEVEEKHLEDTRGLAPLSIPATRNSQPAAALISSFIRPFDLSLAPLMRVGLIKLPHTPTALGGRPSQEEKEHRSLLIVDMHHIIIDAASQEVLTGEFFALVKGEELTLLRLQYKDYAEWQYCKKYRELRGQQEAYWLQRFSDELPVLHLPLNYPRPEVQSFEGYSVAFVLDETGIKNLKDISAKTQTTHFMSILAVFNILLSKLSGQEDIIVGTPIAARRHTDLQPIVGMFVNTLALRNYPTTHKTLIQFLKEVKAHTLTAYENQEYAFEDLVDNIAVRRDTGRNPVFDVMFSYLDRSAYLEDFSSVIEEDGYKYDLNTAKFDLNLSAVNTGERFLFNLEYCTRLFKIETIYRIIEYFKKIIGLLPENREQPLSTIEIITEKEKEQLLVEFNGTKADFPADKTIHGLFEEQTRKSPHHNALIFTDHQLTYKELNKKANQLARHLRTRGTGADEIVGLMVERSLEMIIGILAIIKAGGAYLPLDPEYPQERKKHMILDSAVKILLTNDDKKTNSCGAWGGKEIIDLRDKGIYRGEGRNPDHINNASDLVYVIYTSGSTGRPKGVMLEHRNLVNLLIYGFEFTNLDFSSVLQFATICFDASFHEIFSALLSGGKLTLINAEIRTFILELFKVIEKVGIKTVFLPISFLKVIFSDEYYVKCFPGCVAHIQTAGEQVVVNDKFREYLQENNVYFHNHYGPAEAHVVTTYTMSPSDEIPHLPPIGKPTANTAIHILDKYGYLQPVGVTGELYIGGVQVGRGYLNNPGITAEKFDHDLWDYQDYQDKSKNKKVPGKKNYMSHMSHMSYIYKTGDLSRWLPDGNIEFLGRIDHQVKIRGYRVEPGEIENQLLKHKDIKETVVLVKGEKTGDKYLCAYVVPRAPGISPDSAAMESVLREFLSGSLPDYMIPSRLVLLEEIPLTPNGKIDRKALPEPGARGTGKEYTAPRNEIEKKLVDIWEQELGTAPIGIHDNFFELGGHSLAAIRVLNKMHKTFGVELTIRDLFQFSFTAGMARLIQKGSITGCEEIEKQPEQPYYELSYSQKRLWYIIRQEPHSPLFNMPLQLTLYEAVDEAVVRKTLEQLTLRHESLRTSFKVIDTKPVQVVEPPGQLKLKIEVLNRSQLQWDEVELEDSRHKVITEESSYIFNLEAAPLFRVRLIKWKAEEYDLVFNMHHLISDGWSLEILKHEFNCFYEANKKGTACEMVPLRLQYKDYAAWQNQLLADEEKMARPKEFWKDQLLGTLPVLNLPYDFSRPADSKESAAYRCVITEAVTLRLREMAIDCGASLFMVLLAGFNIFLSKITGQEEIIIAIPAAARQHEELKNIVGLFVNTLIIRTYVNAEEDFSDFFKRLRDNTLKILEYQGIPLELICGQLKIKYPTIPVFFNMTNIGTGNLETLTNLEDFHMEKVQDAKFDMVCYVNEYQNGIEINCHYFNDRFKPLSIEKLINLYEKILDNISAEPAKKIEEYTLTGKERTLKRKSRAGAGTVKLIKKK